MTARILLKTTIPSTPEDWHIGRFALLRDNLAGLSDAHGPLYDVTARDRVAPQGDDEDLAACATGAYDQLWLFAVDVVDALTTVDAENIAQFRKRGGGILITRDHQDLGASLIRLGAVGATQHFQRANPEPESARWCCDDKDTPTISWPNYHSGANGDLQTVTANTPLHPLLARSDGGPITRLPAHPHEGAVGVPSALRDCARVVAAGRSTVTGLQFNLCVAVEEPGVGRAVSDASFHHFCDYNWDPRTGCPSFVNEPPGDEVLRAGALDDTHAYVGNIAAWLSGRA